MAVIVHKILNPERDPGYTIPVRARATVVLDNGTEKRVITMGNLPNNTNAQAKNVIESRSDIDRIFDLAFPWHNGEVLINLRDDNEVSIDGDINAIADPTIRTAIRAVINRGRAGGPGI